MIFRNLLCVAFLLLLFGGCNSSKPVAATTPAPALERVKSMSLVATTSGSKVLAGIPSASGIEHVGGSYYVIGDDAPYLYKLNRQYNPIGKTELFKAEQLVGNRVPKATKPDLENLTTLTYGRDTLLLALGSGAALTRNKGYLVNLSEDNEVLELDFSGFYTFLKKVLRIEAEGQLNIEGLAMDKAYVYFLQRTLGNGSNVLFRLDADAFKDYLFRKGPMPAVAVYHFSLPSIGQRPAGFSGAYALNGKLFFTASVEVTPNAIDDGEVLGSFVGVLNLDALPFATDPANPLVAPTVRINSANGQAFAGKVESLVVTELAKDKMYSVIAVTDDDQGGSNLLEMEVRLD